VASRILCCDQPPRLCSRGRPEYRRRRCESKPKTALDIAALALPASRVDSSATQPSAASVYYILKLSIVTAAQGGGVSETRSRHDPQAALAASVDESGASSDETIDDLAYMRHRT
jgi:hypothetical protein